MSDSVLFQRTRISLFLSLRFPAANPPWRHLTKLFPDWTRALHDWYVTPWDAAFDFAIFLPAPLLLVPAVNVTISWSLRKLPWTYYRSPIPLSRNPLQHELFQLVPLDREDCPTPPPFPFFFFDEFFFLKYFVESLPNWRQSFPPFFSGGVASLPCCLFCRRYVMVLIWISPFLHRPYRTSVRRISSCSRCGPCTWSPLGALL